MWFYLSERWIKWGKMPLNSLVFLAIYSMAAIVIDPIVGSGEELNSLSNEILMNRKFNFSVVLEGFQSSKREDGQLYLNGYISAYSELNKFIQSMGYVFGFVASDVQKKITMLQCYQKGGAGDYYYSVQSMIEYEIENNLLNSKDRLSGSRTLLRLHRALEFIIGFLEELRIASDDSKLGSISSDVYQRTLAKFHSWIIAKTVSTALLWMPTKLEIIQKITGGDISQRRRDEQLLPKVIEVMNSVYHQTQKLYEDYNLLNLP